MNDDDDIAMAYCPKCGREVYEFIDKCPHCGSWITPVYRSPGRSRWRRLFVLLIVALLLYALFGRYLW